MGKNELSAHLEAYLLYRYQRRGGTIVKCAPTLTPQTLISRLRLESVLDRPWLAPYWKRAQGSMVTVGNARVMFLSAHEQSNVVGATADLLLEVDEAQDVDEEKFAKEFLPMAAAQNATIVLYGTPWTKDTLLAKYKALNLVHAERTGEQRHFSFPWQVGAQANPRYGAAVKAQIRQRGEDDLVIRTQYRLEEVDDATGFFTPPLQAALQGRHVRQQQPRSDAHYVAAVDVAGEETAAGNREAGRSRRDSTVVLIGERVWRHDPVLGFALPAGRDRKRLPVDRSAHHRAIRAPRAPLGQGVASPKSKHRRHRHGRRARALLERAVGPRPHRTIYIHGANRRARWVTTCALWSAADACNCGRTTGRRSTGSAGGRCGGANWHCIRAIGSPSTCPPVRDTMIT